MNMKNLIQKNIELEDHNLVYYEAGEGVPILFIHGISTYSFIWRNIAPEFINDYRVIVVDLFGCGQSDLRTDISFSLANHARFMLMLMDKLNIDDFHIVSHDVGGGIAQIMSTTQPQRVISTTLINTVAYNFWPVQPIIAMRTPIIRQLAAATLDAWSLKLIVKRGLYHTNSFTNELMELFKAGIQSKEGRRAFLHFAHSLNNEDLTSISEQLHQINVPFLIIRGAADVYLSSAITQELVNNLRNCDSKIIQTAGHFAQEDEPQYIINEILSFILLNER